MMFDATPTTMPATMTTAVAIQSGMEEVISANVPRTKARTMRTTATQAPGVAETCSLELDTRGTPSTDHVMERFGNLTGLLLRGSTFRMQSGVEHAEIGELSLQPGIHIMGAHLLGGPRQPASPLCLRHG
jgi:hypothetical protein